MKKAFFKPLNTFWTEQKLKVHRFTNNLEGLEKVMVKDFHWNIIPWNALLFEKLLKQLPILDIENNKFILNTFLLPTPMTDWAWIFTGLLFYT